MWNYLIILGQIALRDLAKSTLIPSAVKSIQSTYKATKSLSKSFKNMSGAKKAAITKGIKATTKLVPTPARSALNYTLKSIYKGEEINTQHMKNLIKGDIKKSLYNTLVPSEIKSILSLLKKADQYIERKIKEATRFTQKHIKEEEKRIWRENRAILRRIREIRREIIRQGIEERKIQRYIIQKRRELFKKIQKQLKMPKR